MVVNCSMSVFSTFWILDSGAGAHICIMNLDDLERSRKLGEREVMINVGSGHCVMAIYMRSTSIHLYSGHVLVLEDCLVLPNGLKNIVFVPVLVRKGYVLKFGEPIYNIYLGNELVGNAYLFNRSYYLNV